jgi:uncharacterized protein YecE (DUF72 family)
MLKEIHVGTMGWSYNFWKDQFYSSDIKPENFLHEYSKHFDTVEVHNTFYRIPTTSTIKNWDEQTEPGFLFSIKVPKKITHGKLAKDNSNYLDFFFTTISNLGPKIGPILFQFPPNFKFSKFAELENLISTLPKKFRYALEVRNKNWFTDKFFNFLHENKIALVLGDGPCIGDITDITTDFTYFRWKGNRKQIKGTLGIVEKDRTLDIKKLGKRIQSFSKKVKIFGYFSKYYSGNPPRDAKLLLEYLSIKKK